MTKFTMDNLHHDVLHHSFYLELDNLYIVCHPQMGEVLPDWVTAFYQAITDFVALKSSSENQGLVILSVVQPDRVKSVSQRA